MWDKDRLQICWQAFSVENSLLQSYRMLFMMTEAALLALGYVLLEVYEGAWILVPGIIGWIIALIWVVICAAKARDVDRWMNRIVELQAIVEKDWFDYLKPGAKLSGGRVARYLFNYIMPLLVAVLWIFIVLFA